MASVGIESGDHSCPNEHGIFAKLFSESLGPDLRWPFLSRAGVGLCISAYFSIFLLFARRIYSNPAVQSFAEGPFSKVSL